MKTLKALWAYILAFFAIPKKEEPEQYLGSGMAQNRQPPPPFQTGPNFSDIRWNQGANAGPSTEANQVPRTPALVRLPLPTPTYYDELVLAGMFDGQSEIAVNSQWWLWVDRQNRRLKISPYPKNTDRPAIVVDTLGATSYGNLNMPTVEILSMFSTILAFFREQQAFDHQPERIEVHRLFSQLVSCGIFDIGRDVIISVDQWEFRVRNDVTSLVVRKKTQPDPGMMLNLSLSADGITLFGYTPPELEHHLEAKAALTALKHHILRHQNTTHKEMP